MRELTCRANGKAFYSMPSNHVRFSLDTKPSNVNGRLAGGAVMSLTTAPDSNVVAV